MNYEMALNYSIEYLCYRLKVYNIYEMSYFLFSRFELEGRHGAKENINID